MKILGIETSCDETGAAVVEAEIGDDKVKLLSNVVASSVSLHVKTGGIIPEVAAREQVRCIIPVIDAAMSNIKYQISNLDAIAVTVGPGLIGSLLVGVETAKTLSYVWNKPIIPVNHLIGHIYANFIESSKLDARRWTLKASVNFPALVLVVSGGHTDLVLMKSHQDLKWLGGTRDDAAGEAFDKIARLLGLGYPGGPAISAAAEKFQISNFKFQIKTRLPRPMMGENNFDFSFSGLKTAVFREVNKLKGSHYNNTYHYSDLVTLLAFETQEAIIDVLIEKTLRAAKKFRVKSILLSGGVAANRALREKLKVQSLKLKVDFRVPTENLCTDNAAMVAAAAFFNYHPLSWKKIKVSSNLHF